jgi:hypothetical protein
MICKVQYMPGNAEIGSKEPTLQQGASRLIKQLSVKLGEISNFFVPTYSKINHELIRKTQES